MSTHSATPAAVDCDPLAVFVANAHAVARASDPTLARLLKTVVAERPSGDTAPVVADWSGEPRAGLMLCRRMLEYVSHEMPHERIEMALHYIEVVLDEPKPRRGAKG